MTSVSGQKNMSSISNESHRDGKVGVIDMDLVVEKYCS